jgi:hypothetical protein
MNSRRRVNSDVSWFSKAGRNGMNYRALLLVALVVFTAGVLVAAKASNSLGKQVWSPHVFAWRNPLRPPPKIDLRPDSPLIISNPRYYSFMSIGSGVGGVLRFDITNRSNKAVHSYDCRYDSPVPVGNGSYGSQPEEGLLPGQSRDDSISAHEYAPLTLTIDFVQFDDGTTWFSNSPQSTVKRDGLKAGAKAAANYLLTVMTRDGVQTVMTSLPRIHADVNAPLGAPTSPEFGIFGFYCGVTNIAVRVQHEYKDSGAHGVEIFLRSYPEWRS